MSKLNIFQYSFNLQKSKFKQSNIQLIQSSKTHYKFAAKLRDLFKMFRSGNKSRVDIKDYLKEMRLSQSVMSSRNSSQDSGSSGRRSNQQEIYNASQGKKDTRTVFSLGNQGDSRQFFDPPTQSPSEILYPQNKYQQAFPQNTINNYQHGQNGKFEPNMNPNNFNNFNGNNYPMISGQTNNSSSGVYNPNGMMYPSFYPYYHANSQMGTNSQTSNNQQLPMPPYPYFMYHQFQPAAIPPKQVTTNPDSSIQQVKPAIPKGKKNQEKTDAQEQQRVSKQIQKQKLRSKSKSKSKSRSRSKNKNMKNNNQKSKKDMSYKTVKRQIQKKQIEDKQDLSAFDEFIQTLSNIRFENQQSYNSEISQQLNTQHLIKSINTLNQLVQPLNNMKTQFNSFHNIRSQLLDQFNTLQDSLVCLIKKRFQSRLKCTQEIGEDEESD